MAEKKKQNREDKKSTISSQTEIKSRERYEGKKAKKGNINKTQNYESGNNL